MKLNDLRPAAGAVKAGGSDQKTEAAKKDGIGQQNQRQQ